jgi:hypothetical protein
MKSLRVGTGRYLCKVYNYHDSQVCGYKRSRILPRIEGMVLVWVWYGLDMVLDPSPLFQILPSSSNTSNKDQVNNVKRN